jgi:hypothetical protein
MNLALGIFGLLQHLASAPLKDFELFTHSGYCLESLLLAKKLLWAAFLQNGFI